MIQLGGAPVGSVGAGEAVIRYLVGFVFVLALVASPVSVSAQAEESEEAPKQAVEQEPTPSSEPAPEEPEPSTEPGPEEPALQLKLDDAGVEVVPSPPRTFDGYTLEEMELRVKKARRGLIGTSVILGLGVVLWSSAAACSDPPSTEEFLDLPPCFGLIVTGLVLTGVGLVGMIVSGPVLGARKRKLRRLDQAHYGTPRRVQWDLARSRVVF
jgi:hypothetical protein